MKGFNLNSINATEFLQLISNACLFRFFHNNFFALTRGKEKISWLEMNMQMTFQILLPC